MGTKSIRLNDQEEMQLKKITKHYNTSYREFIKSMIHEKAEELADIDFIENNEAIGSNNTLPINNLDQYISDLF